MKFRLELSVIQSTEQESRFALVLHNLSESNIENWQLAFSVTRYVKPESVSHGTLEQIGSLCLYQTNGPLDANSHLYLEFSHDTKPFTFFDEGITDASMRIKHHTGVHIYPVEVSPIHLAITTPERVPLSLPPAKNIHLIPQPKAMIQTQGHFTFNDHCAIACGHEQSKMAAHWLAEELTNHLRQDVPIKQSANIQLIADLALNKDQYRVSVKPQEIHIFASSRAGFVHGAATLLQLLPHSPSHRHTAAYQMPCVEIEDHPRFNYRGMMLDCARHFHPIERIKGLINQLARYKFNYFHWHLTDDEGWRIEIDAYPELTEIGAWRGPFEVLEPQYTSLSQIHGGFYTKAQIRDLIQYAQQRGITIIPEFDIPGHCRAAIKSLPHLLVEPNDRSEYRSIQNYTDNVLNPGIKTTYTFLETVLREICELFPSPYIHIGADEVPKNVWSQSPACQILKQKHGYQTEHELQGHLLRHVETFLNAQGKKMMGWEEAVAGDKVSKETTIFAWISEGSAFQCIKNGYPVVMQPGHHTYLDMAQDESACEPGTDWACKISLDRAYHYEPFSEFSLNADEQARIQGIQCALWCELTHNQSRFEYMIYPRLLALAEVCWSAKEQRDWLDFQTRLSGQLSYLDRLGINYRR